MSGTRPRIGVTRWEEVLGERIESYWEAVREAGGDVIDLAGPPPDMDAAPLDGLLLTGGQDVVPARYGATPHPKVRQTDPDRDAFEVALVLEMLARGRPVFAICRGVQMLNVAMGGSLLQHIESYAHSADYRVEGYPSSWHTVRLVSGSRLHGLLGTDELEVNSRHHQAVLPDTVAPGLIAVASAPDGVVEAVESPAHRWVVGVQWHPERDEPDHPDFAERSRRLFGAFIAATAVVE